MSQEIKIDCADPEIHQQIIKILYQYQEFSPEFFSISDTGTRIDALLPVETINMFISDLAYITGDWNHEQVTVKIPSTHSTSPLSQNTECNLIL